MKHKPLELERNVRRRRSPIWALGALLLVVGFAYLMRNGLGVWFLLFPGSFAFLFAKRTKLSRITASEEGLAIDGTLVPRARLASPLVRHEDQATYVAFAGRPSFDVEVKNNLEADALIEALALDAASVAIELKLVRAPSPIAIFLMLVGMFGAAAIPLALMHTPLGLALMIVIIVLAAFINRILFGTRVRIGSDGLMLRGLLARQFVAHDQIVDATAEGARVIVRRSNGTEIRLDVPVYKNEHGKASPAANDEALAIVRRLRQAQRAHREGAPVVDLSAALDRGAQTTLEWLADLRKLGEGTIATFRTVGIAREQLLDVALGTTATAKNRIAALVALRPSLREEEKVRIRVATERIAAPDLRDHMVRVLDEDDEATMAEALEAIDQQR